MTFQKNKIGDNDSKAVDLLVCDQSLDPALDAIKDIRYRPWIGNRFLADQHSRVLVVAESVYAWEENGKSSEAVLNEISQDANFARRVVREHGLWFRSKRDDLWNSKVARGVERAITGEKSLSETKTEDLWHSIAFHEFVQRPLLSERPEHRPGVKDFQLGAKVFNDVLKLLRPNACIFLGTDYRKFRALEKALSCTSKWLAKIDRCCPKLLVIPLPSGHQCTLLMIRHPSSYFSWPAWHELIARNIGLHEFPT